MRKVAKVTLYSVCLAVLLWFFLSWLDIVWDNCEPNPHNSPYNIFILMAQQEEKTEEPTAIEGTCGSPLTDQIRLATAIITNIDGNTLTLVTLEDCRNGQSKLDMARTSQQMTTCVYSSIPWELTRSMMTRLPNSGKRSGKYRVEKSTLYFCAFFIKTFSP
jgi:hypothetical protein